MPSNIVIEDHDRQKNEHRKNREREEYQADIEEDTTKVHGVSDPTEDAPGNDRRHDAPFAEDDPHPFFREIYRCSETDAAGHDPYDQWHVLRRHDTGAQYKGIKDPDNEKDEKEKELSGVTERMFAGQVFAVLMPRLCSQRFPLPCRALRAPPRALR